MRCKAGCVLAPTLFALYFAAILKDATKTCNELIEIKSRTDKSIFDLSHFRAKRQISKLFIMEMLYADDVCLMADSAEALQSYVDSLNTSCRQFGLVISVTKTQVLVQTPRGCHIEHSVSAWIEKIWKKCHTLGTWEVSFGTTIACRPKYHPG